ncbi:MAG: precorrin-4 C(11)-methyltransferase [Gammaproteobacteria bacterium]|nr:precorrin-4 C(11)-methyltransferase [Gammaproteobacteria bacterium]
MKVYFIGAGPGAHDLITVRGAELLKRARMVLYAGSLVPPQVLCYCRKNAEIIDTAALNLDEQEACYRRALEKKWDVARVHSGDPSIYGATAEQMRRLDKLGVSYEVVPGVSSFTAAAAVLSSELTKPNVSQTIILTRVSGRASPVPEKESLGKLAKSGATLCIFLSGPHLKKIVDELRKHYPDKTPVALVYRATWPDQRSLRSTLGKVVSETKVSKWKLTSMMIVGDVLATEAATESSLYAANFKHKFRKPAKRVKVEA